jgi:hypothetical protein
MVSRVLLTVEYIVIYMCVCVFILTIHDYVYEIILKYFIYIGMHKYEYVFVHTIHGLTHMCVCAYVCVCVYVCVRESE